MNKPKHRLPAKVVAWLLISIAIYAAVVTAYCFFVLLYLRDWLKHIFDTDKVLYAICALPLIIVQAALLECVIRALRKLSGEKSK
jgi:hypothetical protein